MPDGSAIAFPLGTSIQLVTSDGTDAGHVLDAGAEVDGPIVYSKDGSAIAFFVTEGPRDANVPLRHVQISSASGSPLGSAPYDGAYDKDQWIGNRAGLLAFANHKLKAVRPDGTGSVEIPGPVRTYSYDWYP